MLQPYVQQDGRLQNLFFSNYSPPTCFPRCRAAPCSTNAPPDRRVAPYWSTFNLRHFHKDQSLMIMADILITPRCLLVSPAIAARHVTASSNVVINFSLGGNVCRGKETVSGIGTISRT